MVYAADSRPTLWILLVYHTDLQYILVRCWQYSRKVLAMRVGFRWQLSSCGSRVSAWNSQISSRLPKIRSVL